MQQFNRIGQWTLALSLAVLGCTESDKAPDSALPAETDTPTEVVEEGIDIPEVDLGESTLKKLTRTQYENSLRDVFGAELEVPPTSEPDAIAGGLASVGASTTTYSSLGIETFEKAAFSMASQITSDDTLNAAHIPCEPTGTVDATCAETTLRPMGRMLWRRDMTENEIATFVAVAGEASETLGDFYAGLEFGIAGLLQSPHFLYRVELGELDEESGKRWFTNHEMASRLSYFLWNSTPDAALLEAADAGVLTTEDGLLAQTNRLMDSPRFQDGLRTFFEQYLELDRVENLTKDPTIFDFFTLDLGPLAAEETLLLLDYLVSEDRDFRELLTTRTTHLDPMLASLYGVPAPTAVGFGRINLPESAKRAGLLGHASFLGLHSHSTSTSVTRRGVAVRTVLLCQTIPSPPVDVDTAIPEPSGETPTMRDRVAEHLTNPSCAGCHLPTDEIGLSLENFDGVGRYREGENGAIIDPSGKLDKVTFDDALGLAEAVANHRDFAPCVVQTLTRYAMGRTETKDERPLKKILDSQFEESGYRLKSLILDLVQNPLFRQAGESDQGGAE